MEKADRIRTLSKKEIAVLYWSCMGLNNREIEEKLEILEKTRSSRQTRIYAKLKITGDDANKRDILLAEYCPIIQEIVNEDTLKTWIPIKPLPEDVERYANIEYNNPDEPVTVPLEAEPTVSSETEPRFRPNNQPESKPINFVPEDEANRRRRRWIIRLSVILGSIIVILIIVIWYLLTQLTPEIPLNLPSTTPENALLGTSAPVAVLVNTETSEPTATYTKRPSSTPQPPTLTPTPTITRTDTPTPIPPLFSDNFNDGISPDWKIYMGNPLVVNGMLSANEPVWMEVGDPSWTDIKIEYEVNLNYYSDCWDLPYRTGRSEYTMLIGLRYQDNDNMIVLKTGACGFVWFTVKDGEWEAMPVGGKAAGSGRVHKLTIIAKGNKFTAYLNGDEWTSFVSDMYPTGKIGLRLGKESYIDNFEVNHAP